MASVAEEIDTSSAQAAATAPDGEGVAAAAAAEMTTAAVSMDTGGGLEDEDVRAALSLSNITEVDFDVDLNAEPDLALFTTSTPPTPRKGSSQVVGDTTRFDPTRFGSSAKHIVCDDDESEDGGEVAAPAARGAGQKKPGAYGKLAAKKRQLRYGKGIMRPKEAEEEEEEEEVGGTQRVGQ